MFPLKFSANTLKWLLSLYPPLLLNGIWVRKIDKNLLRAEIGIRKTLLNQNANGSIFGGSLYLATDPFYVLLFHQYFTSKGYRIKAWLKSGHIDYIKPVKSTITFHFELSMEDFNQAEKSLLETGKFIGSFPVMGKNKEGEVYVQMISEVYIRDIQFPFNSSKPIIS